MRTLREIWQFSAEKKDYTVDFAGELDGDTISTAPWSAVDAGPTLSGQTNTATTASVFITGGTAGGDYRIRCTATTAGGRVLVAQLVLHTRD